MPVGSPELDGSDKSLNGCVGPSMRKLFHYKDMVDRVSEQEYESEEPHIMDGPDTESRTGCNTSNFQQPTRGRQNQSAYLFSDADSSQTGKGSPLSKTRVVSPNVDTGEFTRMRTRRSTALIRDKGCKTVSVLTPEAAVETDSWLTNGNIQADPCVSSEQKESQKDALLKWETANKSTALQLEEFLKILPGSQEKLRNLCRGKAPKNLYNLATPVNDGITLDTCLSGAVEAFEKNDGNIRKSESGNAVDLKGEAFSTNARNHASSKVNREKSMAAQRQSKPSISQCKVHSKSLGTRNAANALSGHKDHASHDYASLFEDDDDVICKLRNMFVENDKSILCDQFGSTFPGDTAHDVCLDEIDANTLSEWFPVESSMTRDFISEITDISGMLNVDDEESQRDELGVEFIDDNAVDSVAVDVNSHMKMLRHIHESLYTSSDISSLRTIEKFMVDLLQPDSDFGSLSAHGRLMTFISLAALRRHMFQLFALYQHPEMSLIRDILYQGDDGYIKTVLNISEAHANGQLSDEASDAAIKEIMNRIDRNDEMNCPIYMRKASPMGKMIDIPAFGGKGRHPVVQSLLNMKSNRELLNTLDELSELYKHGCEPHFPRYVCGSIDRKRAKDVETLSIPFDKSDRRNIHVQFESFDANTGMWPDLMYLPHSIAGDLKVQVNCSKQPSSSCWTMGTVKSNSSGILLIAVDATEGNEVIKLPMDGQYKGLPNERMFMMRNFVPPNVPTIRIEKARWRLLPIPLDVNRHIYVGSCISVFKKDLGGFVDMVILNVYYEDDNKGGIAAVKPPEDESLFQCTSHCGASDINEKTAVNYYETDGSISNNTVYSTHTGNGDSDQLHTCHCKGHTLRVFEGKSAPPKAKRVVLSPLSQRKEIVVDIEDLHAYKLNYDLQAHFDFQTEVYIPGSGLQSTGTTLSNFQHCVWVVPRHLRRSDIQSESGIATRVGSHWFFEPEKCLVIFPYNRNMDILQECSRMVSFLHPELNYNAVCTGIWSIRGSKNIQDVPQTTLEPTVPVELYSGRTETTSYTRSQKAATRELKMSDIVSEACNGVTRCSMSLVRRMLGCNAVISLWIALDGFDTDKEGSNLNLAVKIPMKPECDKCGGKVYASDDITKNVAIDEDVDLTNHMGDEAPPSGATALSSGDIPIFRNLESTEVVIQRIQNLSASRWRLAREFVASSSVDDELYPASGRGGSSSCNNQQARYTLGKSTFLNKFVELMGDVRKSNNVVVDEGLYRRAFQWSDRYFNTRAIEDTLMRGWGAFLTNKPPRLTTSGMNPNERQPLPGDKDYTEGSSRDGGAPDEMYKDGARRLGMKDGNRNSELHTGKGGKSSHDATIKRKSGGDAENSVSSSRKKKKGDKKGEHTTSRGAGKNSYGSQRNARGSADGERKRNPSRSARIGRLTADYTRFNDKDIRFKFISVVKWDEDLESDALLNESVVDL